MVPIFLQITIDGASAFMATGYYVPESQWNEKKQEVRDGYAGAKVNITLTANTIFSNATGMYCRTDGLGDFPI